jgi:CRP-like cAMP-binding protein
VVALEDVEMFKLSREQFLNVLTTQPLVGWEVSRSAIGRLRFATTSIENAIEWSKQIAAGNYDSVAEETRQSAEEEGMTQSDQERSQRFRETFFQMVKEVREREEELKEQVQQLKVVIDQQKREQEVSELASSEFFQNLQKSSKKMREEGKEEE